MIRTKIECSDCGRDGVLDLEHGVIAHPQLQTECKLPPRVKTPELKPTRYPSPYRVPRLVGRDGTPSRWFE